MDSPTSPLRLQRFFSHLGAARERVLFLDYDGTLAPFHVDPRLASPYPAACELLREIAAAPRSRVVIVSGRRYEDLADFLDLVPHHEAWASHGWERMRDGCLARRIPSAEARQELESARHQAEEFVGWGARVEGKVASVALHWRGLPPSVVARMRPRLLAAWRPLAKDALTLLPFDGGLEVRVRGRDKGRAVHEVLSDCSQPVSAYLGDDLTDEDAFRAMRGRRGLPVLVREERRPSCAEIWLPGPEALAGFLRQWRDSVVVSGAA